MASACLLWIVYSGRILHTSGVWGDKLCCPRSIHFVQLVVRL